VKTSEKTKEYLSRSVWCFITLVVLSIVITNLLRVIDILMFEYDGDCIIIQALVLITLVSTFLPLLIEALEE
jgi:hypothetical protein